MIKKAAYALLLFLLRLLALLPFSLLYLLSTLIYFVTYHILCYRKSTVANNLKRSFPEKTEQERKKIQKQFYINLSRLMVEVIKMQRMSADETHKRMHITNPGLLEELYQKQKSVFVALGHCGNWEWLALKLALMPNYKAFGIAKPLSNPYFDSFIRRSRKRFGGPELIDSKQAYRTLLRNNNTLNAVIILGDQTPARNEINFWTDFLGQETPFFLGLGKMAHALGYAVVFFDIKRKGRGYYEIGIKPVTLNPMEFSPQQITEKYVSLLEQSIVEQPDNWLWSHRRWKHKKQPS